MIDVLAHPAHRIVDGFRLECGLCDHALAPPIGRLGEQQPLTQQRLDVPVADVLRVLLAMRDQHLLEHLGIREHVQVFAADWHSCEAAMTARDVRDGFHGIFEEREQATYYWKPSGARRMFEASGRYP